jgi:hypothetical protein
MPIRIDEIKVGDYYLTETNQLIYRQRFGDNYPVRSHCLIKIHPI